MLAVLTFDSREYTADLSQPIDLSIPLRDGVDNPNCFWAPMPSFSPVKAGDFVGSTAEGGVVNFFNVQLNPHGNGTHTECVGHIAQERFTLNESLCEFHFLAKVVTLYPYRTDEGDRIIFQHQLEEVFGKNEAEALIIRTMPNDEHKFHQNYSGTNPPYLHHEGVAYLVKCGVRHLLLDLPSVDREEDGGLLLAHRAFWQYPESTRSQSTITEMIYVPNTVRDGLYLLNLQITSLELDASPSKPVIFALR